MIQLAWNHISLVFFGKKNYTCNFWICKQFSPLRFDLFWRKNISIYKRYIGGKCIWALKHFSRDGKTSKIPVVYCHIFESKWVFWNFEWSECQSSVLSIFTRKGTLNNWPSTSKGNLKNPNSRFKVAPSRAASSRKRKIWNETLSKLRARCGVKKFSMFIV